MDDHCLQIKNLNKRICSNLAIEGLDLKLTRGKKVALLGLNGAGKSSFIRLLIGESKADSGDIHFRVNDHQLAPNQVKFKSLLGNQADTMLAIDQMKVKEYLTLCAKMKRMSNQAISSAIDFVSRQWNIVNLLNLNLSNLSKGNLQKVTIAQAFIGNPTFLFFDEPCQNLDPLEQDRFNQNIKSLTNVELCLFSTHNVEQAIEIADEILLVHQANVIFHFNLRSKKNYVVKFKKIYEDIQSIFEQLSLENMKIANGFYLLIEPNVDELKEFNLIAENKRLEIDFCLLEEQSVIPIFRLLASGELFLV